MILCFSNVLEGSVPGQYQFCLSQTYLNPPINIYTILYPINCVCWNNGDFGPEVFETALDKGMGILSLKAVAKTRVPKKDRPYPNMWYMPFEEEEEIDQALRFTLSKDITATVHGGDSLFMQKTLDFILNNKTIEAPDAEKINSMISGVEPIFYHPNA